MMTDQSNSTTLAEPAVFTTTAETRFPCLCCGGELSSGDFPALQQIVCPLCESPLIIPGNFAHFRVYALVRLGRMGRVYWATNQKDNREICLKVINQDQLEPYSVEHILHEHEQAVQLSHPNITRYYSTGIVDGHPYVELERQSQDSMQDLIDEDPTLSEIWVSKTALAICQALSSARSKDLVHGDIRPANIRHDKNGGTRLNNFGLGMLADASRPALWGNPQFFSPEKLMKNETSPLSDQYSLGVTLWYAMTKKLPYGDIAPEDAIARIQSGTPIPDIRSTNPRIHPELADVITKMTQFDPAKRFSRYMQIIPRLQISIHMQENIKKGYTSKPRPVQINPSA
ncbi:serine/threonine protein kinase [Persicirhabdus sediminis]|uniref:Serine/threonine protein kinase n=1 Tax=Persicirhabdus sediminis TaxID=454144 RepID=A0A8J7MK37_9BACT|nr:serine/threonine-protein kinase [Persicirhabdus sediminis]MBK1792463.1 serine/threonine protein kinase [Persicirhabdus sediminis]